LQKSAGTVDGRCQEVRSQSEKYRFRVAGVRVWRDRLFLAQ